MAQDLAHDGTLDRHNLVSAIVQHCLIHQCRSTGPRRNFLGYQNIVSDEAKVVTIVLNKCLKLICILTDEQNYDDVL